MITFEMVYKLQLCSNADLMALFPILVVNVSSMSNDKYILRLSLIYHIIFLNVYNLTDYIKIYMLWKISCYASLLRGLMVLAYALQIKGDGFESC